MPKAVGLVEIQAQTIEALARLPAVPLDPSVSHDIPILLNKQRYRGLPSLASSPGPFAI